MDKTTQRQPSPSRKDDRLVPFPEIPEIVPVLTEATLRYLRHKGEGPPIFKLGRRLVCWESDLFEWIDAQAAKGRRGQGVMTALPAAAGDRRRDDAARDPYETAVQHLAAMADLYRGTALASITSHVHAAVEVVRAREVERGGSFDADVTGVIEALRTDICAHLDRLARSGG